MKSSTKKKYKKNKPSKRINNSEKVVYKNIMELEGFEEFKAYISELETMRERLYQWNHKDSFPTQHLLFSINSGDGCSTALNYLYEYISTGKIYRISDGFENTDEYQNTELTLRYSESSFLPEDNFLTEIEADIRLNRPGIIGIHIDDWINRMDSKVFKKFMKLCFELRHDVTFVFIVPYLDESTVSRVYKYINDIINVRLIRFSPHTDESLINTVKKAVSNFDIKWDNSIDRCLKHRLINERSDGRFYGMQTAMKLATEIVLLKTRNAVLELNDAPKDVLTEKDFEKFMQQDSFGSSVSGYEQLDSMIGLDEVKQRVREIVSSIKAQKYMNENGENGEKPCYHMMFTGNPGTGKTAAARIIGHIFKENGLLPVGDLLEVTRFDMVGDCIGHTGPKTLALCRSALGSVMFIDEAYLLASGSDGSGGRDFGEEALGALIAEMENNRDKFIVILAGYEDQMEKLCEMNPGLRERVPHRIHFCNYSREELFLIFKKQLKGRYDIEDKLYEKAHEYFLGLPDELISSPEFGNARFVRNIAERVRIKALMRQNDEISEEVKRIKLLAVDFESAIIDEDIKRLNEKRKLSRIGF